MVRLFRICLVFLCVGLLSFCGNLGRGGSDTKAVITIAGSTSVMPFTEKLAEHFMVDHPRFVVNVQGGGSTAGIQACLNRTVDLGMSSRPLKSEEKVLNQIIICHDGISLVVHPNNPIRELSLEQVRAIFSGKLTNWKSFGWENRKIDAVTREEGSGTRGSFEELVMKGTEIDDGIMVQDSNGSVKEVVATDPYAIGYISFGLLDRRVVAVAIDGRDPNLENIKLGHYRIVRPFLYLTNGEPEDDTQEFLLFVLGKDGQSILKKEGLVGAYD
jgi:phosphate transport system substrate-binding protein